MTHTPGPWKLARNGSHAGRIAVVHGCMNPDPSSDKYGWLEIWSRSWVGHDTPQHMEANARLIAAAPELYDVLCDIVGWLEQGGTIDPAVIEEAKAVIAKTEGLKQ